MKKLSILFVLGCCTAMYAQDVKYGVTAKGHASLISTSHNVSKPRIGGSAGVFAAIPLNSGEALKPQNMYIQPQLEYSLQGEYAEAPGFDKQEFNNNYITAVVYFKYFFSKGEERSDFYLFAGPKFEYLVSENRKTSVAYDLANNKFNNDLNLNKFGFGLSGGAGYALSNDFELFLRYDHGLSKVYPDNGGSTFNAVLGAGINYTFNRKKEATDDVAILR